MCSLPLKRYSFIIHTLCILFFVNSCSNISTNTSTPTSDINPNTAIIGNWKWVGMGDSIINGTAVPENSPGNEQLKTQFNSGLTVEYQFYKDGTVKLQFSKKEPGDTTEIGTYKLIADGTILNINLPPSEDITPILGLRRQLESNTLQFNITIQGDKLILKYTYKNGSLTYNFTKIQ